MSGWEDILAAFELDLIRRHRSAETIKAYRTQLAKFGRFYQTQLVVDWLFDAVLFHSISQGMAGQAQ